MIALLAASALGATDEVLVAAVKEYPTALTLPDAPATYHLRAQVMQLAQVDVRASMGALTAVSRRPWTGLSVEARVGKPEFDNTGFGGWQNGFVRSTLPVELTDQALRLELWRATDRAYKQAVEQYARKEAQFEPPTDWPGDYTLTGAVTADLGEARAEVTPDRLSALARTLSARLTRPDLRVGEVHVGHEAGSLWTVDSEGTKVRVPLEETTLRAMVQLRAKDGAMINDQRLFVASAVDTLPDDRELEAAVDRLRDGVIAAAEAPAWSEEYVGPVVWSGDAAVDLFRYLLVPQLEGTPAEIPFDSFFGEIGSTADPVRVGRRVLPPGFRVVDDPTANPKGPAAYEYDQEGTKATALDLVDDGIVRTLAMSRSPRRGLTETNGHARGSFGQRTTGRVLQYEVTPDRSLSETKLDRAAAKAARAYGRDWWVVVERLQDPAVMGYGNDWWWDVEGMPLPPPVAVKKRYADGREELFHGARWSGVAPFLLRDIVAAGASVNGDYLAPLSGEFGSMDPVEGLPCHSRVPSVLVGEVELVPEPGDPSANPQIPPPPVE